MKHVKTCMYCATNFNLLPGVLLTPLYGPQHRVKEEAKKQLIYAKGYGAGPALTSGMMCVTGFRLALKFWNWHLGWEWHAEQEVVCGRSDCM